MKLVFCMQINIKACCKLKVWFWWIWSSIPKVPKIASLQYLYNNSKKKLKMLSWFFACKYQHQKFPEKTLRASNSPIRLILLLLMGMIKYSQITQSNKFAISSQYLKREVRNWDHFCYAHKCQSFYKLVLFFLIEVALHVQNTQNRKLVIFLQYIKKKLSQLLCVLRWCKRLRYFLGV